MNSLPIPLPCGDRLLGFEHALDRATVRASIERHLLQGASIVALTADYVRYKHLDGALVGWRVRTADEHGEHDTYVTARSAAAWRLRSERERFGRHAEESYAGLRGAAWDQKLEILFLARPLDRSLGDLRRMLRPSKVRAVLLDHAPDFVPSGLRFSKQASEVEVLSYKPERRAVLRWSVSCAGRKHVIYERKRLFVRVLNSPLALRSDRARTAARQAGLDVPSTLAMPHPRLLMESAVRGSPISRETTPIEAVAALLAQLHSASIPDGTPPHSALSELDDGLRIAGDLALLDPDLGAMASDVLDQLAKSPPGGHRDPCLLHGDFHLGQLLRHEDGLALVDFDRVRVGAVEHDLATFCADDAATAVAAAGVIDDHAPRRESLLDAYRAFDAHAFSWYFACALLRQSMAPFRRLDVDWPANARALLGLAGRAAEEATR